jgi:hypothetical protein
VANSSDLIEQNMALHEAHLKRIDELFEKANAVSDSAEAPDPLLSALRSERDQLATLLHQMQNDARENWQEVAERHFGPLAIWEALARVLEQAIESHEKNRSA